MGDLKCSACMGADLQKLSMVYQSGTSVIDARTTGTSTGIGMGRGGLAVGTSINNARTQGVQMTELAKRAAPPAYKLAFGWIVIGLCSAPLIALIFSAPLIALAVLAGCVAISINGFKYNANVYPGLRAAWEQSWLCHRCGAITQLE